MKISKGKKMMTAARLPHQHTARFPVQGSFLIVGQGNQLQGDDAAGAQVANAVASWNIPNVTAMTVHQLIPELAIEISKADYVIFIDACGENSHARSLQLSPISASISVSISASTNNLPAATHTANSLTQSAQELLALTKKVYGRKPQAWLLQVPTESFDFGKQLSSTAQRGIDKATQTIERFIINYRVPYPVVTEPYIKSA